MEFLQFYFILAYVMYVCDCVGVCICVCRCTYMCVWVYMWRPKVDFRLTMFPLIFEIGSSIEPEVYQFYQSEQSMSSKDPPGSASLELRPQAHGTPGLLALYVCPGEPKSELSHNLIPQVSGSQLMGYNPFANFYLQQYLHYNS